MAAGETGARLEERHLAQPLREIGDLSRSFNTMADQIERAQEQEKALRLEAEKATEAKSMFLANVSHEIRTPMNGILGLAEVLRQSDLNDHQAMLLSKISESGKGLTRILNDVLDSSRIEAGISTSGATFNLRR